MRLLDSSVNWLKTLVLDCALKPYTLTLVDHILNNSEFLTACATFPAMKICENFYLLL